MGDANITLTDAQALRAGLVMLTGSNTAVRKVTLPSKARRLAIQNSTGGTFAITVGYATGATVSVGNGAIVLIQGNGTNCYGVGGAAALGDLADVVGPFLNGDLLQFDGAAWRPAGSGILSRVMLPFNGALVRRATTQAVSATTNTQFAFSDAVYDTDSFWSGGSPTRLTVPNGVTKVQLWGGVAWYSGSANGTLRPLKNGATFLGRGNISAASGFTDQGLTVISAVIPVVAGDYFEAQVYLSAARTVSADGAVFGLVVVETSDAANPTLLALTDTPSSYSGAAGKLLRVNAGATGVEFGPRQNLSVTSAPTATDDGAAGYGVGSCWLDTVAGKIWFCTDATASAAVWKGATLTLQGAPSPNCASGPIPGAPPPSLETIMDFTPTLLWQVVTTLAIAPLAYFLKASLERLRQMELCLSRTREQLAREYATKADLHADVGRVLARLDKLDGKLDRLLTARFGGGE